MRKQGSVSQRSLLLVLLLATLLAGVGLFSVPTRSAYALNITPALSNGLALTPPMGWDGWNTYACNINEALVKKEADAMVSSGMKAAGYQYINLDDCWAEPTRDSKGNLVVNKTLFPDGMKALADYVHSKGLKMGTYTDAGSKTCASPGFPGMEGHEQQDANAFASWGIDYVKIDWCNHSGETSQAEYTKIGNALKQTGRPIVYALCEWGNDNVWQWGPGVGNSWRTTQDMHDTWAAVIRNFDGDTAHPTVSKPGAWNDADMLEVGHGKMSTTEYIAHFSLWSIADSPLIAGNDLTNMTAATKSILLNTEVIAVDQDKLGIQATKVADNGAGLQVWAKRLSGTNTYAIVLFNRNTTAANIKVNWSSIGLSGSLTVRDLWAHANKGSFTGSYTANVAGRGVVMLKVVK
jgi:alpha-galactosidase